MSALSRLAEVSDLADWLGEPISEPVDVTRAEGALSFASALVVKETGKDWTNGEPVPDTAQLVTLQCAARGYTNPESWRDERTDDWGGSGRPISEVGMYLTVTEKRLLADLRPAKPAGIGVIGTYREPTVSVLAGWVPTEDGPLFPWY